MKTPTFSSWLLAMTLAAPAMAAHPPRVSAYSGTTCAVVDGAAYCWGYNADGQVGNNSTEPALAPAAVSGLGSGVTAISVGLAHACAVANGAAYCWGDNSSGQLGDDTLEDRHTPVQVLGLASGVTAVAAGDLHSCAIVNGALRCWGANGYGQLGDGNVTARSRVPVAVLGSSGGATVVSAGHRHTCAVASGGGYCWGDNQDGALGNGGSGGVSAPPVAVSGFADGVTEIVAGNSFSCGTRYGAAYCWGFNGNGQLGNGGVAGPVLTPQPVVGLAGGVTKVEAGDAYHGCAVVEGAARCWGYNNGGQLGNPDAGGGTTSPIAVAVLGAGIRGIAAGGLHTCAVGPAGIYCWGDNAHGQLGRGNISPSAVPVLVVAAASTMRTDLNGDGRSDILYRNATTGAGYRLLMNGLAIVNGGGTGMNYTPPYYVAAEGDFNGDGITDVVWREPDFGQTYVALVGADGTIASGAFVYTEPNPAWKIVATPDLDGDGKSDLLWWNSTTGQVYAMLMEGAAIAAQGMVYTEANTSWRIVASGDFHGSGVRNQVVWRNVATGQVYLQVMDLAAGISGATIYLEPDTSWKIVGAADFTGDERTDLLWRNDATGQVYLMPMNGYTAVPGAIIHVEPNPAWKIVALGDYDGNGKSDILWRNDTTGQVYMMLMNGTSIAAQGIVYGEPDTAWKIVGPGYGS